ncbi:MAG TPA: hypothetical protein VFT43_07360, partial [Candidatus Polarisedimenticolia bacterium]|nr:hypothetical protein [Candidatus Polarisedimenticolia bacterium]
MRPRSCLGMATLLLLAARPGADPAIASGATAREAIYLLGPDGAICRWRPGLSSLEPVSLPWLAVNDLAPLKGGDRLLILADAPSEAAGRGARRPTGEAVLLDAATTSPTPIRSVPFEGRGFKGVATADGRRAYLLSYHSGKGKARETPGAWIHEIDLVAGKEGASAALARLPNGLAVDPAGRRLFVSFQDEILTYTTSPLASSWRYRSPGVNRGLYVAPGGDLLYAVRERQVALFQLRPQAAPGADAARRSR